ncbi:type II toxin-antitoxin system RelE/ParE family toxin [Muribacter muris]|uniref:Type II toxin-antitoxin system RelE/ParE family toxin n=1 Tax=Muribacter muris TaxID=67855 RepID=A0A4Y9JTX0_9PAST|nr:type II toxin-antitoxin system RelE/ParE family toxin [Muribacter muris]MBF0785507.1 type II toxin-antitoxin system RelE/ParE family toxin [Muribacter muris]MBF0826563.1 type II toxin-antitoxin system RelE/ParE family toxin [Muribacter muris]TFV09234.1 type II toxin-antitoxin system RelE/ParE family toxin [Muribacter muris]
MYTLKQTPIFRNWFRDIKDPLAKILMVKYIEQSERGMLDEWRFVGSGIYEMRVNIGEGYRIYFAQGEGRLYLLTGSNCKTSQQEDIEKAKLLWSEYQQLNKQIKKYRGSNE